MAHTHTHFSTTTVALQYFAKSTNLHSSYAPSMYTLPFKIPAPGFPHASNTKMKMSS